MEFPDALLSMIDIGNLKCTFCEKQPVVGFTFAVDAEINAGGEILNRELVEKSIIAVCKEHLPILKEMYERDKQAADFSTELSDEGNV